jgi:HEAT repeat protein
MLSRFALLTVTLVFLITPSQAADSEERTKALVAVLQSDTAFFEKARACQQLGEIGTAEAVPALANLLLDPKLSAYARSGLEGIPDPSTTAALRDAAQRVQGPLQAGLINSLGVLRDAAAADLLKRLAADPASEVAREALLALGNIATPDAIRFLQNALVNGPEVTRGDAAAACLLAADRERLSNASNALALYDLVRKADVPMACRVGATRGAILARNTDRLPFLMEQLRSSELAIRNAALLTLRELDDADLPSALNTEVARATPELQGQLLLVLADRHNAQSVGVVQAAADSPNPQIRLTALAVLGRLGAGAAPALIAELEKQRPASEKPIVLAGLKSMDDPTVDERLVQALASASAPPVRADLIGILESRGATNAAPEIMRQASAADKVVKMAAFSALKTLGSQRETAELIRLTKSASDEAVREAAESALGGVCSRSGSEAPELVLGELKRATNSIERNSWIRVLARIGYPVALPAIEAAAADRDATVADNALTELGRWPSLAPMETLLKATEAAATPALRKRALASALDLASAAVDENLVPAPTVAAWLARANPAVQSTADKLRLVGLLGRVKAIESFRLLLPYLDDPGVQVEAASAVVQIAPALASEPDIAQVQAALERIASSTPSDDLRNKTAQVSRRMPASLFDGRSLTPWEGDTNVWRVRDGVIVGGSMNGNPRNEFLATVRSYTNFVLRLEYKLVGTEGFVNSGVQFRSVRVTNPPNEMKGYQADIGADYSGCLYDESRRNKILVKPNGELIKRIEKPGDWNRYEVRCQGKNIQLFLNGEKTVDYTEGEANIPQDGLIGLQIHGGNKAEVSFRNITIQEL